MTATVRSETQDGVCVVTLDRPHRLNAINGVLVRELGAALEAAMADAATRVVMLRGAGRAFCSGDDLVDFPDQTRSEGVARAFLDDLQRVSRLIVLGAKPVIGAVHGWAVGGGFEWLINCDIVVMAEGTRCFVPETRFGMTVTGGVTALLPRIVGQQNARALVLAGARIDAERALALGLAWRVVPEAALLDEALALARRLASFPSRGLGDSKRLMGRLDRAAFEAALEEEKEAVLAAFLDPATAPRMVKTPD